MATLTYDSIDGSNIYDTLVYECGISDHEAKMAITDTIANVVFKHADSLNIATWELGINTDSYMEMRLSLQADITLDSWEKIALFTSELESIGFQIKGL